MAAGSPEPAKNCKVLVNQGLKGLGGGNVSIMKTIFPFMKNKLFAISALMGLFVIGAAAADVNGKYAAETQGRRGPQTIVFDLKTDGGKVTGTVSGRGPEPAKIENGKIDGDTITFTTTRTMGDNTVTQKYTGKVSGDTIEFTNEMQGGGGGGRGPQKFTAKKAVISNTFKLQPGNRETTSRAGGAACFIYILMGSRRAGWIGSRFGPADSGCAGHRGSGDSEDFDHYR